MDIDFAGVLTGLPRDWLVAGLLTTLCVTVAGAALATALAIVILALRIGPGAPARWLAIALIEVVRNTPLLVQLLFWYFAAYGFLPAAFREFVAGDHRWATLPLGVNLISPEFLTATWGLGVFFSVFVAEELRAGLAAVPFGQHEAARAQGFGPGAILSYILLPQAVRNAWQPLTGQYLNLMKLSSLASGIGLAEIAYQVRQIESYNAHAFEAFALGTLLYLLVGIALGRLFLRYGPQLPGSGANRSAKAIPHGL